MALASFESPRRAGECKPGQQRCGAAGCRKVPVHRLPCAGLQGRLVAGREAQAASLPAASYTNPLAATAKTGPSCAPRDRRRHPRTFCCDEVTDSLAEPSPGNSIQDAARIVMERKQKASWRVSVLSWTSESRTAFGMCHTHFA